MAKLKAEKQKTKKGIQIFLKYIFRYRKEIIFLVILNVIVSILSGATPYVAGRFFDSILSDGSVCLSFGLCYPLWAFTLVIWLLIQIFARFIGWFYDRRRMFFSLRLETQYYVDGLVKLIYLPLSFHKDNKIGKTVKKIDQAGGRIFSVMEFVFDIFPEFLSIVFGFVFVFIINPIFGFIFLATTAIYPIVLFKILAPTKKLREKGIKAYSKAYGNIYDSIVNIKVVKQAGSEEYEKKRFIEGIIERYQKTYLRVFTVNGRADGFQRFMVLLVQATIFITSIFFIRGGQMTLGELFAVNGYAALIFSPFSNLWRWWNWISDCFISLVDAEKVISVKEETYFPKNEYRKKEVSGDVEFKNVTFSYEGKSTKNKGVKNILRDVSFKVNRGETVAIVGESGVGKTTLADLISGFYFPQRGQILIDGVSTDKIPLQIIRRGIAVVSQDITVFNESVKYNIKYGNFGLDDRRVIEVAKEAGAHEFIQNFKNKYNQIVGERGIKLSGGQRQRIAIAQAILKHAPILVLDEPTSALDARTEKLVTESLERLMEGRTTIIIAHRLSTVRKADKIVVLDKGRVVEIGKHEDLIKNKKGVYRKFYEVQKL